MKRKRETVKGKKIRVVCEREGFYLQVEKEIRLGNMTNALNGLFFPTCNESAHRKWAFFVLFFPPPAEYHKPETRWCF